MLGNTLPTLVKTVSMLLDSRSMPSTLAFSVVPLEDLVIQIFTPRDSRETLVPVELMEAKSKWPSGSRTEDYGMVLTRLNSFSFVAIEK